MEQVDVVNSLNAILSQNAPLLDFFPSSLNGMSVFILCVKHGANSQHNTFMCFTSLLLLIELNIHLVHTCCSMWILVDIVYHYTSLSGQRSERIKERNRVSSVS